LQYHCTPGCVEKGRKTLTVPQIETVGLKKTCREKG